MGEHGEKEKNREDRESRRLSTVVHGLWHEPEMDLRYQSEALSPAS